MFSTTLVNILFSMVAILKCLNNHILKNEAILLLLLLLSYLLHTLYVHKQYTLPHLHKTNLCFGVSR